MIVGWGAWGIALVLGLIVSAAVIRRTAKVERALAREKERASSVAASVVIVVPSVVA